MYFQEELIKKILIEDGIITAHDIEKALLEQKKLIKEGQKKISLLSIFFNQKDYSFYLKNPITEENICKIDFPIRKKFSPEFESTEWYPIASNNALIFSEHESKIIDEILWNPNEEIGITLTKEFSYLQVKSMDKSYYFPAINSIIYDYIPSENINCLPIDIFLTLNKKNIYFTDRGSGSLYIFDLDLKRLCGLAYLRPAGMSKKTLNVASSVDGRKLFVTDNESPSLFIIDSKNLKIKKQSLSYGNLSCIYADENWLYILVDKLRENPQIVILDIQNLILKNTINLAGNLFSQFDDPSNIMLMSPTKKTLIVMTYINKPALFTPIINVIDLETFEVIDQVSLYEIGKPTYITFSVKKPEELIQLSSNILDILLKIGSIKEEDIKLAIDKINNANKVEVDLEEDNFQELSLIDEEIKEENKQENKEEKELSAEEKYPVLHKFELDPSLLLAFKEEQMKYFSFMPINKMEGKFTLAIANPSHKETIKKVIEQKFPEFEVILVDLSLEEFNRFMKEFYSVIKEKYDNIIANKLEAEAIAKEKKSYIPENTQMPKTDMPPGASANIPSDVRDAVRQKLKLLDPDMIDEAIMAILVEDFYIIWGIKITKSDVEKFSNVIINARKDLLEKDFTYVKISNFYKTFSLETLINQEKLVVMLKNLMDIANGNIPKNNKVENNSNEKQKLTNNCKKCNIVIPIELDICSKCSREEDYNIHAEEIIRSPSSPDPLANLPEGNILISDINNNRVIEINSNSQIVWKLGDKEREDKIYPYFATRLKNGNTLIADSENDRIIEFTKSGRVYWELKNREGFRDLFLRRPVLALRLINGNTLIVDQGNHRVFEINHLDKIVWQYGITATVGINEGKLYSPSYAQRLQNGHTLITDTDNHRIIEIDENDQIIWQFGNPKNKLGSGYGNSLELLNSPLFAYKLPNNNVLITDTGNNRIIEINQNKEVVSIFNTSIQNGGLINLVPIRAYRLKNGNTLIFSNEQIAEINNKNELIKLSQIEYIQYSPDYKEEKLSPEEEKIINERLSGKIIEKAKIASSNYAKTISNLSEIEIPLIDKLNHKIFIINRYKSSVWKFGEKEEDNIYHIDRPQYVELIKDEYVLIADTDNHRVIKVYRPTKEIVWEYGIKGIMGSGNNQLGHPRAATMTPNNNILITDQYSCRIIEVNHDKQIVWSFGGWTNGKNILLAPYYAQRLENSNTLITDWSNHTVIEVDLEGNIIWQFGSPRNPGNSLNQLMYPEKAIKTSQGTYLISDTRNNRILELDDSNKIVWEFKNYRDGKNIKHLVNPTNVFRLDNGNTIIIHNSNKSVLEVDINSQVLWQYQVQVERKAYIN
ncbi:MAG: hypothetical protein KatS3mg068_1993 [Candidatus Sericytochromatia bacterium]|nr:MAG: hypothetical protein KatS3mg068_1993 [Candidatus Sericytochromatia bacterium]